MTRGLGFLTASAGTAFVSSSVLGRDLGSATHVWRLGPDVSVLDSRFKQYLLGAAAIECVYAGMHGADGSERSGRFLAWPDIPNDEQPGWPDPVEGSDWKYHRPAGATNLVRIPNAARGSRQARRQDTFATSQYLYDN